MMPAKACDAMLLDVPSDHAPAVMLHGPRLSVGRGLARLAGLVTPRWTRAALAAAACFGVVAFTLGAGNRLTRGPWFLYPPDVSLIPPFGRAAWQHAFVLHQQSPLYALCGGYDVGGMESITIYQFLYGWEWLRIAGVVLLAVSLFAATSFALLGAARAKRRLDPMPSLLSWLWLAAAAVVYLVLRYFADHAGLFATINLGQHRHALDISFASVGLAVLIVAAVAPRPSRTALLSRVAWGVAIALTIGFGALFEALDAGPLWSTFPGYGDGLLPAADRLFAFHPLWRNFTENGYLVQACHRLLSVGLWAAAVVALLNAALQRRPWQGPLLLLALLSLEGALGIAALAPGQPALWSILHQVCAIAVLAAALAPPEVWRSGARAGARSAWR
jgi:heme A synthase